MGKIDSTNSEQLDFNRIGEAYFDCASVIAERGSFPFALRGQGKPYKTLIIETSADRNGNLQGYVDVYLGSAVNGSPWRTVQMGGGRGGPVPSVDFLTFVPRTVSGQPSLGTVSITLSTEIWGTFFKKPATATYFPLEDLTDAAVSSPVAGQVLTWNGTDWTNATPSGGSSAFDTAAIALPNIAHYWKCNDATGVTGLVDSVGVANLPVTGNALTQGRPLVQDNETSLQTFGGSSDGVAIAKNLILPASTASAFTLFFVVRALTSIQIQSTGGAQQFALISDIVTNAVLFDMRSPSVSGGNTPSLVGYVGSQNSEGTGFRQVCPGSMSTFLFTLVDNGSGTTSLYIDGALAWSLASSFSRTGTLCFMNDTNTSPSHGTPGSIGKIGVCNGVLTQAQMQTLLASM